MCTAFLHPSLRHFLKGKRQQVAESEGRIGGDIPDDAGDLNRLLIVDPDGLTHRIIIAEQGPCSRLVNNNGVRVLKRCEGVAFDKREPEHLEEIRGRDAPVQEKLLVTCP